MSAHDYLASLKKTNARIFQARAIKITIDSLEAQIIAAFNAGKEAGRVKEVNTKSLFERIMGKMSSDK